MPVDLLEFARLRRFAAVKVKARRDAARRELALREDHDQRFTVDLDSELIQVLEGQAKTAEERAMRKRNR